MSHNVILLPRAAKEITIAAAWYAQTSPRIALRWRDELLAHVATLEHMPERFPKLAAEGKAAKRNIRYLLHGKKYGQYRIVFEIRDKTVYVLAVRHTAQQKRLS